MGFFGRRSTSWRQEAKFDLRSVFSDRKSSNSNIFGSKVFQASYSSVYRHPFLFVVYLTDLFTLVNVLR